MKAFYVVLGCFVVWAWGLALFVWAMQQAGQPAGR